MNDQKWTFLGSLLIFFALLCSDAQSAPTFKNTYKVLATVYYTELFNGFSPGNMNGIPLTQTIGDLNGDGVKDIIISTHYTTNGGEPIDTQSNTLFFISTATGAFEKNLNLFENIPSRVHAREGIIADFNCDCKADIFNSAHGLDGQPFLGEQNILMLTTSQNTIADASLTHLPLQNDMAHGAGAGDIDGDGDIDIFIATNHGVERIDAYFLINDGTGNFRSDASSSRISGSLIKFHGVTSGTNAEYLTAKFFDMNGDNAVDLLLATAQNAAYFNNYDEFYYSRLVYNNGNGGFFTNQVIEFSAGGYGATTQTTDIDPIDINGDGKIDLILSQTDGSPSSFFKGQYHQVLINNGTNSFIDQTSIVIPSQDFANVPIDLLGFPNQTFLDDINSDGNPDIIVNSLSPLIADSNITPTRVYLNDGNGKFFPLPNKDIFPGTGWVGRSLVPIDVDKDGDVDIVGINYFGSPIVGFQLVLFENISGSRIVESFFSARPVRGNVPLSVCFSNQSRGNITSWQWNFGDGSTSTERNPSHKYSVPGKYTVSLRTSGPYGSDTKYELISVYAKPNPILPILLLYE